MFSQLKSIFICILYGIVWYLISVCFIKNEPLFPNPITCFYATINILSTTNLFLDVLTSLVRVFFGMLFGFLSGLIFGFLTYKFKVIDYFLSPIFLFFKQLPPVALIPLFVVWFGIDEKVKIITISLAVFLQIWLGAMISLKQIKQEYLQGAKLLTNSKFKILIQVIAPQMIPYLINPIQNSISTAYIMVFVSELVGSSSGIGYRISVSQLSYRIDEMVVYLLILGGLGFFSNFLFNKMIYDKITWLKKNYI